MWKYMESTQPTVFVKNYDQGIKRVKKGNYAFLMESTVLDYVVQVCILVKILLSNIQCYSSNCFNILKAAKLQHKFEQRQL